MKTLGNILWYFPFFGFLNAIVVWIVAGLWAVTIVGLPIAKGLFEFGKFLLKPFGNEMIAMEKAGDAGAAKLWNTWGKVLGIVWIVCFGWWMAIIAVFQIAGLFISIVGIPVAIVIGKVHRRIHKSRRENLRSQPFKRGNRESQNKEGVQNRLAFYELAIEKQQ